MLRELAELWLKKNCLPQTRIPEFLRMIDSALERNHNCWFRFGSGTTKNGAAWLMYCYESEFFAFTLDQRQVSLLNLKGNDIIFGYAGIRTCTDTKHRPAATLKPPEITAATTDRIAGSVAYEMPHNHMLDYSLRMTWDRPDGRSATNYHYPDTPLMPVGVIPFDFQLNLVPAPHVGSGLVLAFFALNCELERRSPSNPNPKMRALSDTQAILLELK